MNYFNIWLISKSPEIDGIWLTKCGQQICFSMLLEAYFSSDLVIFELTHGNDRT